MNDIVGVWKTGIGSIIGWAHKVLASMSAGFLYCQLCTLWSNIKLYHRPSDLLAVTRSLVWCTTSKWSCQPHRLLCPPTPDGLVWGVSEISILFHTGFSCLFWSQWPHLSTEMFWNLISVFITWNFSDFFISLLVNLEIFLCTLISSTYFTRYHENISPYMA